MLKWPLILLLLAGCSPSVEAPPPRAGVVAPTFAFAQASEPRTLDPGLVTDVHGGFLASNLFEGLLVWDAKGEELLPGAAASWSVSDDGLLWTFQLRPEAIWSNGDPVTANDFVLGWRRVLDPSFGSAYASLLFPISGARGLAEGHAVDPHTLKVEARDRHTLQVQLDAPTSWFPQLLAHHVMAPVNGRAVKRHGWAWTRPENIVVNGPFTLTEWTPEGLVLVRNAYYHHPDDVKIARVIAHIEQSPERVLARYETGELQWTGHASGSLPLERLGELAARPDAHQQARLGTAWYALNAGDDTLRDGRVRRALLLALDRAQLGALIGPSGLVAQGLVPPGVTDYEAPQLAAFDPEQARNLLGEAGFAGGEGFPPLELSVDARNLHERVAAWTAESWGRELGIEVSVFTRAWPAHVEAMNAGTYQVGRGGWAADYRDPASFLEVFHSDNPLNDSGWTSDTYDRLIEEASRTTDGASRLRLLSQAERILLEEVPVLPLFHFSSVSLLKPYVGGFEDNALGVHLLKYLTLGTTGGPGFSRGDRD